MLQWLYTYVSSLSSKCFICIRHMLQVCSSRCCKSSPDVAYTCMLQAYFSCGFMCFIRLLQAFHQNVAYMFAVVFKCFSGVFASVSNAYFKCFICLLCMLQLLHLDVSKDRSGLHMGYAWEATSGVSNVWCDAGPLLGRSLVSLTRWDARSLTV
jgi:hypothetical protein